MSQNQFQFKYNDEEGTKKNIKRFQERKRTLQLTLGCYNTIKKTRIHTQLLKISDQMVNVMAALLYFTLVRDQNKSILCTALELIYGLLLLARITIAIFLPFFRNSIFTPFLHNTKERKRKTKHEHQTGT